MAKTEVKLPTDIQDRLLDLAGTGLDSAAKDALKAGASVVDPRLRGNLAAAIGAGTTTPSRSTGQLLGALGITTVKTDRDGDHNVKVGFHPSRTDGRTNALVATVLEYGRSDQAD